ncbi:tyrosine-type recombinase/integrase [Atrimonas thermophila]|uniref:tyrosine-type recombinase/integrase n=1 Tax=Atrimonas thermophila TaxID=3064161 RepID=UPI00399C7578
MKRRGNREGSIYKRKDGRWCGALFLGYDFQGKPIRKYFYGKTRQEVVEKLTKALRDQQVGLLSVKNDQTFGEWIWSYLELYKKQQVRPTTYELYRTILKKHLPPRLASIQLSKLRPEHLQRLYLEMSKKGLTRSIRILHVIINSSLKQALKLGYVYRNVAEAVTLPRYEQKEIRVLSQEEIGKFLSAAKKHRLYPAFLLLLVTGLRRGELLGLKWEDVDFEKGAITIKRNLVYVNSKTFFQEPKTKHSQRSVPLPDIALIELKKWRKKWLEERMKLGSGWPETDLVFPSEIHTPINPRNFLRTLKNILREAGLPQDVTIHSLRHTCATMLLSSGEHPKIVQELLGHSSVTITLDTYSKVMPGLKEQAVKKLEQALKKVYPQD